MLLGILRNNKVRLDSDGVKRLILSVDAEKLNEQLLAHLSKFLPSKEEMQQLGTYKDKLSELSDAEQFGAMVSHEKVACGMCDDHYHMWPCVMTITKYLCMWCMIVALFCQFCR